MKEWKEWKEEKEKAYTNKRMNEWKRRKRKESGKNARSRQFETIRDNSRQQSETIGEKEGDFYLQSGAEVSEVSEVPD
jgi:hypothetical protein